jgi:hypothetical protein
VNGSSDRGKFLDWSVRSRGNHDTRQIDRLQKLREQAALQPKHVPSGDLIAARHGHGAVGSVNTAPRRLCSQNADLLRAALTSSRGNAIPTAAGGNLGTGEADTTTTITATTTVATTTTTTAALLGALTRTVVPPGSDVDGKDRRVTARHLADAQVQPHAGL